MIPTGNCFDFLRFNLWLLQNFDCSNHFYVETMLCDQKKLKAYPCYYCSCQVNERLDDYLNW